MLKYGLNNFNFCVFEYFTYDNKIVSHKALTDLETSYIEKYPFDNFGCAENGYKSSWL